MQELTENTIGTYYCDECHTSFEITGTSVVSGYEGWVPTCPVCGVDDEIVRTE